MPGFLAQILPRADVNRKAWGIIRDMDTRNIQVSLRAKALGVLIRDARLARRLTVRECAQALGVKAATFRAYEEGRKSPSLPEIELLAYFFKLPLDHFWQREILSEAPQQAPLPNLPLILNLRHRMIGANLRQERMNAGMSLKTLAERSGISISRLKAYELGERPIPLAELELLLQIIDTPIEHFFDQSGPIGRWMAEQQEIQRFLELPFELREFISKPVNRPYLELAMRLSELSTEKLRAVAEGLLDITL
jgi:transcriptional regulator with XRE-family HTH domain